MTTATEEQIVVDSWDYFLDDDSPHENTSRCSERWNGRLYRENSGTNLAIS